MSVVRRGVGPVALGVVLAATLLVGSGVFDPPAPVATTRIAGLERIVRCPSCTDLSVAQSNDPSSIAVRTEIAAAVRAGQTDSTILDALTSRYGTSILLVPPSGGIDTVLWAVPAALVAGSGAAAVVAVRRRRRSP